MASTKIVRNYYYFIIVTVVDLHDSIMDSIKFPQSSGLEIFSSQRRTIPRVWLKNVIKFAYKYCRSFNAAKITELQALNDVCTAIKDNQQNPYVNALGHTLPPTTDDYLTNLRRKELFPFFVYFDALNRGETGEFERRVIFANQIRLLDDCDLRRQNALNAHCYDTVKELEGRMAELATSAVVNLPVSKNDDTLFVPSLEMQDSAQQSIHNGQCTNHDGLYIHRHMKNFVHTGWGVTPTQIKSRFSERATAYKKTVAIILANTDLDYQVYTEPEKPSVEHPHLDTLLSLLHEYQYRKSTALQNATILAISHALQLKLSSWKEHNEFWMNHLNELTLIQQAKGRQRSRQLQRDDSRTNGAIESLLRAPF